MKRTVLLCAVTALCGARARATPVNELVRKADTALRSKTSASVFEMAIKTASYERSYKVVVWDASEKEGRTLIHILGPALWRGYGTLKLGGQLKLYNPRANQVTVVGHSMLGESWMGSHFSNDDLVKETRLGLHYHAQQVKSWKGQNEAGQAATYYLLRLTPKPTAPVAWGKVLFTLWESGPLVLPTRAEYFRQGSAQTPDRVLAFGQVKLLGGRQVPTRLTMTVAKKPGEHTTISYQQVKFDIPLPESKFTEQALRF